MYDAINMKRTALSEEERLAVQAELVELHRKYGSDPIVAGWLGVTQQAVYKARTKASLGPLIALAVYDHLGTTREAILTKFRASHGAAVEDDSTDLGLPPDKFHARAIAARRALISPQWKIPRSAVEYVCTAPEWQAPQFEIRDPPFWIDVMKAQTLAEARAQPANEEERKFHELMRAAHEKRARERKRAEAARGGTRAGVPAARKRQVG
jgi:hypothetical protein